MRKTGFAVIAAMALGMAGCGERSADPAGGASSAAVDEAPDAAPGISVTDAVVRLPLTGGAPGVAYFTISQGSGAPRKVAAVHVEGAGRAEMHESRMDGGVMKMGPVTEVPLEPGKSVKFAAGGMHVMLYDFGTGLAAGGETELTVTLDNGDKVTARAKVEAPGGGAGMDHM